MPGATSIYGLPYLELTDPPDIAAGTKNLAQAVETELARIDATPQPTQVEDSTTFSFTNTAAAPGSPVVGTSFTAPASGRVYVTVSGNLESASNGNSAVLSFEVRTGSTVGSGTVMLANTFERAVMTSMAVITGAAARSGGGNRYLVSGLTPGAAYNVRSMQWMTPGGTGNMYHRRLLVEPVL